MEKNYWRIKVVGSPEETSTFFGSMLGLQGSAYKKLTDGRLSIQLAIKETIGEGKGWCKFIEDDVLNVHYYYIIGEIADRPSPKQWLNFDIVVSPTDHHFPDYIHQCRDTKKLVVHTLCHQVVEVPIIEPEKLVVELMSMQLPQVTGDVFYLTAYEKHDVFQEARRYRPSHFKKPV